MRSQSVLRLLTAVLLCATAHPARADDRPEPPEVSQTWGSVAELDNREGWQSLAWGGAPVKDMVAVDRAPGSVISYERSSDRDKLAKGELTIGAFVLSGTRYTFFDGQFYQVALDAEGRGATNGLLQALKLKYGLPTHSTRWPTSLIWQGRLVRLQFVANATNTAATLTYTFLPTERRADKAASDAIRRATRDL